MAVREIIFPDNPILRRKANKVKTFDDHLKKLIDDMVETMQAANGVGLAAPQIALSQRVIVVRLPDSEHDREEYGEDAGVLHVLINPEIARASDEMETGIEGCLSIPGYLGEVKRHSAVTIKAQNATGKKIRIKAQGWLARVFQHEIDHLDGVLFIDKASDVWRMGEHEDESEPEPDETG